LLGVSSDTLRHYERLGILSRAPRAANGYRLYPPDAARRVRLVQSALDVGFNLRELARVLRVRDAGGAPCREVRELAARKLRETEVRLEQLVLFRRELQRLLKQWDRRLENTPRGRQAGLLEALIQSESSRPRHPERLTGHGAKTRKRRHAK
jgi:DNA-binding transcriptional MerR regulator